MNNHKRYQEIHEEERANMNIFTDESCEVKLVALGKIITSTPCKKLA